MNSRRPPEEPWHEDEGEPVPRPWWKTPRAWWFGLAVIAVLVFIFSQTGTPVQTEAPKPGSSIRVVQPYTSVVTEAKAVPGPPTILHPPEPMPPPPPPPTPPKIPSPNLTGKPETSPRPPMLSYVVPPHPPGQTGAPAAPGNGEPTHTGIKFSTATIPGKKASPAIDDTLILYPGLLLIELDTAIDSSWAGPLLAHLPSPVYSRKGVVLLEAGTQVIGKYESMNQHDGVKRLSASSAYAFSPNGVWVSLAGQPLSDPQGRTGLSGTYDARLMERFGGAILLDLASSGLQIAQAQVSQGGNTYLSFNSSDRLASQILNSTINLPPLFTKNPGSLIAIWLAEPIDFSDSYRVRTAAQ